MSDNSTEQPIASSSNIGGSSDFYRERAAEFIGLHDQVATSVNLLDSLESFLSTFQKDLSAVSGQISELQDRSKAIDSKLKSRRKIEKPLSVLLDHVTIPPSLATLILDSDVGEAWLPAIEDFEQRFESSKARPRVKAARDIGEVAEGLRIVAATKLRSFFLALFKPIRGSVTTNMQVIQTSVILKYRPFFSFLQRQAPTVAHELQRVYVGAARVYYETGFRRYLRSLGWIKGRTPEKFENIVAHEKEWTLDLPRLAHGKIEGPGVTLAYMADDKTHKEPIESLFRSALLVLLDNASAEYSFISLFFTPQPAVPSRTHDSALLLSPTSLLTPERPGHPTSASGSEHGGARRRSDSFTENLGVSLDRIVRAEQATVDATWKNVLDPVLEYCQAFVRTVLDPPPSTIPLLTMIRLTEEVVTEATKRKCPPLESFLFGLRLQMWPVFQKSMSDHVDAVKKLAEGTASGYFSRGSTTTDGMIFTICLRYIVLFNSFVTLTNQEEETMIFSNLLRLRQELAKLIPRHTDKITDPVARMSSQSKLYELLLQGLSSGTTLNAAHPKLQQEIAHWSNVQEEVRRKMMSGSSNR